MRMAKVAPRGAFFAGEAGRGCLEDLEEQPMLSAAPGPLVGGGCGWRRRGGGRAPDSCCTLCMGCGAGYAIAVAALVFASVVTGPPRQCAVEDYTIDGLHAFPMEVGSRINIGEQTASVHGVDLTGVWWLRWSALDGLGAMGVPQLEVLTTFAGSTLDGKVLHRPPSKTYHWGYSLGAASVKHMLAQAMGQAPDLPQEFVFANASFGLAAGGDAFVKRSEDEWLLQGYDGGYTLTRVLYEDGTTHPVWWPALLGRLPGHVIRVWGDDNRCKERCELLAMFALLPGVTACKVCSFLCE